MKSFYEYQIQGGKYLKMNHFLYLFLNLQILVLEFQELSQIKSLVKIRKIQGSDSKSIPIAIAAAVEALRFGNLKLAIGYLKKLEPSLSGELKGWLKEAEGLSILETIVPKLEGLVLAKLFKSE